MMNIHCWQQAGRDFARVVRREFVDLLDSAWH
jgi:hypothetical protein